MDIINTTWLTQTPWNFGNNDSRMFSPDRTCRVEYIDANEIVMGGPLGGEVRIYQGDRSFKLDRRFGGPPLWSSDGQLLFIPKWNRSIFSAGSQRLCVISLSRMLWGWVDRGFEVLYILHLDGTDLTVEDGHRQYAISVADIDFKYALRAG